MAATKSASVNDAAQERRRARDERGLRSAAQARADRLPPPPRERRPLLAALAVLLVVGGAVTAGFLALRADERVPMLAAARDIASGAQITEADLTQVPVAAEGTHLIPASRIDTVIGSYANAPIAAGQLMDTTMTDDSGFLQPGSVAVGAALEVGRMPASGLQAGDVVQLVRVGGDEGAEVLVDDAVVSSTGAPSEEATAAPAVVTFIVRESDGAEVAAVAAAKELAVVLVTRGAPVGG